ncbi:MAG TPA: hypothetical protein VG013_29850 [Gemmataceae bacterium]|jgi:hypothetical protein|nr:hypothetical protein [Gemmataceae bacterium]
MTILECLRQRSWRRFPESQLKRIFIDLLNVPSDRVLLEQFRSACSLGLRDLGAPAGEIFRLCTDDAYALEAAEQALQMVCEELDRRHEQGAR